VKEHKSVHTRTTENKKIKKIKKKDIQRKALNRFHRPEVLEELLIMWNRL
jgi:hypothetical protein